MGLRQRVVGRELAVDFAGSFPAGSYHRLIAPAFCRNHQSVVCLSLSQNATHGRNASPGWDETAADSPAGKATPADRSENTRRRTGIRAVRDQA